MKTIIVATNFSEKSNNALNYAGALASYTKAKIILFNSFELSPHAENALLSAAAVEVMVESDRIRLRKLAQKTANKYGVIVEPLSRSSDFKEELDFQVNRLEADLVVLGMSEFFEEWYQDTTSTVIRHSRYPVLAVPEHAVFNGISKILFAFDPGCMHAANKLTLLNKIAKQFNAEVEVCHIEKKSSQLVEAGTHDTGQSGNVNELLHDLNYSYKQIAAEDVVHGLESEIEACNADLLVMVPHKIGFFESILHRSKTTKMSHRSLIPLLSLPNPDLV
jgi:nucleotide-binding universal stress UspA family protein